MNVFYAECAGNGLFTVLFREAQLFFAQKAEATFRQMCIRDRSSLPLLPDSFLWGAETPGAFSTPGVSFCLCHIDSLDVYKRQGYLSSMPSTS